MSLKDAEVFLKKHKFDVYGITVLEFNLMFAIHLVKKIKEINPDSFIFIGGYYPTICTEEAFSLFKDINCCVLGEGELTCLEIIKELGCKKNLDKIDGIAYIKDNTVRINKKRLLIEKLDILPAPKVTYVPDTLCMPIISTRGCYGKCSFCSIRTYFQSCIGESIRTRSPENVVEEMKTLYEKHRIRFFSFQDDIFFINSKEDKARINIFCKGIEKYNLNVRFRISLRSSEVLTCSDSLRRLKEVGLDIVFIGVESFVDRQLKLFNKDISVKTNIEAILMLQQMDINYCLGLILLDPYLNVDEYLYNIRALKNINHFKYCNNDTILTSFTSPLVAFRGSPIYDKIKSSKMISNNEVGYIFADDKVRVLYQYIRKWRTILYPFVSMCNISVSLPDFEIKNESKDILVLKSLLARHDLDFLEELCIAFSSSNNKKSLDDVVLKYEALINNIDHRVIKKVNHDSERYKINRDRKTFVTEI